MCNAVRLLQAPKEASKPTKPSATKKGGGKSAGKGKGKNTPAEPESSVPMPSLPPSTMKKRGEEGDGPPPISECSVPPACQHCHGCL